MNKLRSSRLLALLALSVFLSACGYKGPLYHPPAQEAADAQAAPR
ncbi:LPS translocon maturation chaperone LptM [Alcaligenes faecalis]|uniref:Lipoprotein n=1 Tax=Alcaligenes faecalis TaxID=511 RepID=A0AAE9H8B8_ALCFA|nr:lipoprotein [Alcaligenes faecalis]UPL21594.1 lipoprotein [Alcaligenes faecalis]